MKQLPAQGRKRVLWLGGALLATLLAAQWVSGEDGSADMDQAVEESRPEKGTRAKENEPPMEAESLQLERLDSRKFSAQAGDIFRSRSWVPPPPPPSEKSLRPSPPPLQFKYLGRVTEGEETRIFLALAERNYIVRPGESINSQYRLDEVSEDAITLTYLPLKAKQVLAIAGTGSGDFR